MTKGKPWTSEQEKQLRSLIEERASLLVITKKLDKTVESVRSKIRRLGLEEDDRKKNVCSSSSLKNFIPEELPSVEEMLKRLVAAVNALEEPGLDKGEVLRLRGIISGCKIYKELLVDYLDYRGIEAKLTEMEVKYARLQRQSGKVDKAKADT